MRLLYLVEVSQNVLINQIRPRADDDADDFGFWAAHVIPCRACAMGIYGLQSLFINALQFLQGLVGVRKRLEISQILTRPAIPPLVELDAFLNLLLDALFGPTIRRVESLVAAKRAAARADSSIPIRATEPRVDADFLHASAELLLEVVAVAVETAAIEAVQVCWVWGHFCNRSINSSFTS